MQIALMEEEDTQEKRHDAFWYGLTSGDEAPGVGTKPKLAE